MSRYLIIVALDQTGSDLAQRATQLKAAITNFSDQKTECAFVKGDAIAYLYSSNEPAIVLKSMLCNPGDGKPILRTDDHVLILELGNDFSGVGFSKAWTWLQHH